MSVSLEQVIWAYRILLGREAESVEAITHHLDKVSVEALRETFMQSPEFKTPSFFAQHPPAVSGGTAIGAYLDVDTIDVQTASSPEQRVRMLDQIAREWRKFGETDPHWSVLVDEKFRAGSIDAHLDEFYHSGIEAVSMALKPLSRAGLPLDNLKKAMDFGCGVGRLTLALAGQIDRVVGVDISPPHLALARQRANQTGIVNATFEAISSIEDLTRFSDFDLVISFIVLQHNPPPVMAALYEGLLRALRIGGVAVIQIPTYISGQRFSVDEYLAEKQQPMEMNMLPQKVAFEIIERTGCRVLEVREDNGIGPMGVSQTFVVQRMR